MSEDANEPCRSTTRAMVLLSGGLDSAVALYWARSRGWQVCALEFDYHERPARERRACRDLCLLAGIGEPIAVPLPFLREVSDIPAERLARESLRGAPEGYIPFRNLIFYALAAYHADILDVRYLVCGHIRTDGMSFPDARPEFWQQLNRVLQFAHSSAGEAGIEIVFPLIDLDKGGVIRLGRELGVPFASTWSCYTDGEEPCGACPSCRERARAMAETGFQE